MIEINNLTTNFVDEKFLKGVVEKVLKSENRKKSNLSVVLVGAGRMRKFNKRYRKKNKVTDVLSFGRSKKFPTTPESELGEIVICPQAVKKNAKKFDLSYNKELTRVLIHGVLHLLGYEYEKNEREAEKMEKKQTIRDIVEVSNNRQSGWK